MSDTFQSQYHDLAESRHRHYAMMPPVRRILWSLVLALVLVSGCALVISLVVPVAAERVGGGHAAASATEVIRDNARIASIVMSALSILLALALSAEWFVPVHAWRVYVARLRGRATAADVRLAVHMARWWRRDALAIFPQIPTRSGALDVPGLRRIEVAPDGGVRLTIRRPRVLPPTGWLAYGEAACEQMGEVWGVALAEVAEMPGRIRPGQYGRIDFHIVPADVTAQTRAVSIGGDGDVDAVA